MSEALLAFFDKKLSKAVTNVKATRSRRVFAETTPEQLVAVIVALKEWGMVNVGSITGLDAGENFEVIYHLYDNQGVVLNLKVFTPRENPLIPSITGTFPGVFFYERELMDLLGIVVDGIPPGRRYPLPDNWPTGEYPLRKDWKGLPFNGGECRE